MSVSCDCEGTAAEPVVTPNVGILASTDILAIDQACVDMIYAMKEGDRHALVERMETRHGLRQLSYMKELGMGNNRYVLVDLDDGVGAEAQTAPVKITRTDCFNSIYHQEKFRALQTVRVIFRVDLGIRCREGRAVAVYSSSTKPAR